RGLLRRSVASWSRARDRRRRQEAKADAGRSHSIHELTSLGWRCLLGPLETTECPCPTPRGDRAAACARTDRPALDRRSGSARTAPSTLPGASSREHRTLLRNARTRLPALEIARPRASHRTAWPA